MKKPLLFIFLTLFCVSLFAQEALMGVLNEQADQVPKTEFTKSTFKATRIINSHSVELPGKGVMNFVIQHRFGTVKSGWREFFGIDDADMRIGVEYGIFDWWSIGVGRSSVGGNWDGYARLKFLKQSKGAKNIPFSAVWYSNVAINSKNQPAEVEVVHRVSYAHQLIIARKFTRNFSFQIMPTYTHLNMTQEAGDRNDIFAIGFGARYLVSRSVSINAEYFQLIPIGKGGKYANSLSLGVDIETGGHTFQVTITNSRGLIPQLFLPDNTGYWWDGFVHLGFNINRVFNIVNYEKRQAKKNGKINSGSEESDKKH